MLKSRKWHSHRTPLIRIRTSDIRRVDKPLILGIIEVDVIVREGSKLAGLRDYLSRAHLVVLDLENVDFRGATAYIHGWPGMVFSWASARPR